MTEFNSFQENPALVVPARAITLDLRADVPRNTFWTDAELAIIRHHYPRGGPSAVIALLPHKTDKAIYQKADELEIRAPNRRRDNRRWTTSVHIDDTIRRYYAGRPIKGGVERLGRQVGRPGRWVSHRARQLGITPPRFAPLPWSSDEDDLLRKLATRAPSTISKQFARAGFKRTPAAILHRLTKRHIDRTDDDHYSGRQLAELMGVTSNVVSGWIAKGWLIAKMKGTTREHDTFRIHRLAVRRFIIENVGTIDIRRVEKHWFVDLIAGSP